MVAAMVVPLAASADSVSIGGSVPAVTSQVNVTLPTTIGDTSWDLGTWNGGHALQVGENWAASATGKVQFIQGNDGVTGWSMTANVDPGYIDADTLAHMNYPGVWLPTAIKISYDGGSTFNVQGGGVGDTWGSSTDGSTVSLPLAVKQQVNTTDKAGTYYIYIVYTLTINH